MDTLQAVYFLYTEYQSKCVCYNFNVHAAREIQ